MGHHISIAPNCMYHLILLRLYSLLQAGAAPGLLYFSPHAAMMHTLHRCSWCLAIQLPNLLALLLTLAWADCYGLPLALAGCSAVGVRYYAAPKCNISIITL